MALKDELKELTAKFIVLKEEEKRKEQEEFEARSQKLREECNRNKQSYLDKIIREIKIQASCGNQKLRLDISDYYGAEYEKGKSLVSWLISQLKAEDLVVSIEQNYIPAYYDSDSGYSHDSFTQLILIVEWK